MHVDIIIKNSYYHADTVNLRFMQNMELKRLYR